MKTKTLELDEQLYRWLEEQAELYSEMGTEEVSMQKAIAMMLEEKEETIIFTTN